MYLKNWLAQLRSGFSRVLQQRPWKWGGRRTRATGKIWSNPTNAAIVQFLESRELLAAAGSAVETSFTTVQPSSVDSAAPTVATVSPSLTGGAIAAGATSLKTTWLKYGWVFGRSLKHRKFSVVFVIVQGG
jgi:hypothetical protein